MAGLSTGAGAGAGAPVVKVYHEKSMILPDVSRVLACLYEKDVKFECVKDSYKDILRLQASRSVPVPFYDGDTYLQESRSICRYIAETYEYRGCPFLLGKDVLERASIEQWLRNEEHAFDPPSRALFCHLAFPLHDECNNDIDREKRKLEEVLEVYEQRLGECEFLAGNKFTLADLVHLPNTHHILTSEKFAYLYDSRKNVQRWWNTISARGSWQQVLMDMKSVEEQYQMEEFEQQQQEQWQTEPPPTSGYRIIHIDPKKGTGTESRTVLAPPPSTSFIATSVPSVQQGEQPMPAQTEPQARQRGARDITKEAREADQKRATLPPTQELSGAQHDNQQSKAEFKEDDKGAMNEDDRFSTRRLKRMVEKSDPEVLRPQSKELQDPVKEEIPSVHKESSDVKDREGQTSTVSADGESGIPFTGTRADTPTSADERRATSPPKGRTAHDDRGATEPQKSAPGNEQQPAPPVPGQSPTSRAGHAPASSTGTVPDDDLAQLPTIDQWRHTYAPPSEQKVSPGAPHVSELAKTPGVDRRAPPIAPKETPTDARNALAPVQEAAPSADGISDRWPDKGTMNEQAPKITARQAPPSGTRYSDQIATPAASKQTPVKGEFPGVRNTGDGAIKNPEADKKPGPSAPRQEPVSSSQQTTEPMKGVTRTLHGITGDDSDKITVADEAATSPAPEQSPASNGRTVSTTLKGGTLDARGKNAAATSSGTDSRGISATPRRPPSTPDTQRRNTSDQVSGQAPPLPPFADARNEKTAITEAGQTNTIASNEQPGEIVSKIAGGPAAGPSPMESQKNINESYNDASSIQKLASDQSRARPAENKKQVDDAMLLNKTGKAQEGELLANDKQKNTGQTQATSTNGPPMLKMQPDKNKPTSSNDIDEQTNETSSYRSSALPKEISPLVPEESMREQQLQGGKSSISPQDNVKQGPEDALLVLGTGQPKNRDLLTTLDKDGVRTPREALQKSDERTSSNAEQVKNNTRNSKSDGSSKPTQFDGNEDNLPESQRRGSSTNP